MSPQIQKIINSYPNLYKDGKVKFGFQVGDGWLKLLNVLSSTLESHLNTLPEDTRNHFYVVQVKEKFGTLRFYTNKSDPFMDGAISVAESISSHICEVCGQPGQLRPKSWVKTLCDKCHVI